MFNKAFNKCTKGYISPIIIQTFKFNYATTTSGQAKMPMKLKRKFYKTVELLEVNNSMWKNENKEIQEYKNEIVNKLANYSSISDNCYYILLDKKKCKSNYLDEYQIPHKNLALMLAREWASQKEYVNLHAMPLNTYASSAIRISKDNNLKEDVINTLVKYVESDQICFLERKVVDFIDREKSVHLEGLASKIVNYMRDNFDIELNVEFLNASERDDSTQIIGQSFSNDLNKGKIAKLLNICDPWVIALLEQSVGLTKSPSISLALLSNIITPHQAYLLSHSEEYYQMKINGEVEGHHDIANEMIMGKFYSIQCFNNIAYI